MTGTHYGRNNAAMRASERCACAVLCAVVIVADECDYQEEQAMEVEALESIYMDEFKNADGVYTGAADCVSAFVELTDEPLSYQVHIVPNQDGQNNHVALTLKCVIPQTYPDVEPRIDVMLEKGLSDTQYKEITALLKEQIEENVGMAMVFTLCEAVREYLVENNHKGNDGSEYQDMLRRLEIKKKKDDKEEADKNEKAEASISEQKTRDFVGTAVTVESFAIWRAKFDAEMQSAPKVSVKEEASAKLTGKQLWNKGLVKEDDSTTQGDDAEGENDDDDDDDDEDYEEGDDDEDDDDEEEGDK